MILCYEIFIVSSGTTKTEEVAPKLAQSQELEGMYGQIKTLLAGIEFLNPENPDYWMMHLRRFFARAGILSREVKIVRGICRQLPVVCSAQKNLTLAGSSIGIAHTARISYCETQILMTFAESE